MSDRDVAAHLAPGAIDDRTRTAPPSRPSRFADAPSIYAALVLFGLTVAAGYLLLRLQLLLVILFVALLVASALAGPVRRLERLGLPRSLAIATVYLLLTGLLGALGWYVLPRVLGQAAGAASDLPGRLNDVEEWRLRVNELGREYPILQTLDERLVTIAAGAGETFTEWLLGLPGVIASALFTLVSIFTIASLMLATKERMLSLILSLTHPRHRETTQRVLAEMGERMGAYVRAKLIVVAIVGVLVWATLFFLGSTYPVLVAIFAGLSEIVPRIGPWIGRAAILLAVLPLGWQASAIAMIAHVVIENLKGQVISPLVESGQVEIHPLTAFIAIIAGGILLGWLGAVIAVPLAAVIEVVVEDVIIPWRRGRLVAAERAFAVGPALGELDGSAAGMRAGPGETAEAGRRRLASPTRPAERG
ncbi:MAG: AI-2E family transporter [Chloroflexota bacterium]|nr:AI-2E family transporter [Chloroflexota bacterium]